MKIIDTKILLNDFKKFINETYKIDKNEYEDASSYEESGFKDETYENMEEINSDELKSLFPGYEIEKMKKLTSFESKTGLNSGIIQIINDLENKVKHSREILNNDSIKGKIYLFEDEYEGFIKYNFDDLLPEDNVFSTLQFEPTDEDWPGGYGFGAHRHTLTQFSSKGVSTLLFEILLEYISIIKDSSFVSDRYNITYNAQKKWHIYDKRDDIEKIQLDLHDDNAKEYGYKKLYPDDKLSNIRQDFSIKHFGEKWNESIFSRAYKKKNMDTMKYICNNSDYLEIIFNTKYSSKIISKL